LVGDVGMAQAKKSNQGEAKGGREKFRGWRRSKEKVVGRPRHARQEEASGKGETEMVCTEEVDGRGGVRER